jgi:hypothetical protein
MHPYISANDASYERRQPFKVRSPPNPEIITFELQICRQDFHTTAVDRCDGSAEAATIDPYQYS